MGFTYRLQGRRRAEVSRLLTTRGEVCTCAAHLPSARRRGAERQLHPHAKGRVEVRYTYTLQGGAVPDVSHILATRAGEVRFTYLLQREPCPASAVSQRQGAGG